MTAPVLSQKGQGFMGQWYIAIFRAFPTMNVNHHSVAVDIGDFEGQAFVESQPA